ncbi:MAG: Na+(H+)/acetate symporter ActP [Glaciecola sp.]|jgi:Na+(H+)/acetate symporter ActP
MNILSLTPKATIILNPFVDRFNEGGPLFMSLILICLILAILFLVKAFMTLSKNVPQSKKMMRLVADAGLLGLVIGFLGSIIGMITAFDSIEAIDNVSSGMMAGGLKVSFLTTLFGTLTFIISRIGLLILKGMHKA